MLRKACAVALLLACAGVSWAGNLAGTVTDKVTGLPIMGAIVVVMPAGNIGIPQRDTTDINGRYNVTWTGDFKAIAGASGYEVSDTAKGTVPLMGIVRVDFALVPTGVGYGSVAGTIRDSVTNNPIAGARVLLRYLDQSTPRPTWVTIDSTLTNTSGAYSFGKVLAGLQYRISVSAAGYTSRTSATFVVEADRTTTVDLRLMPISVPVGSVEGTVTDSLSSEALVNAMVVLSNSLVPSFSAESTFTNLMGMYRFGNIPAGTGYVVTVSRTFYYAKSTAVTVVANDTVIQNVALRPYTATVGGLVSNRTGGAAVAGAKVVLKRREGTAFVKVDSMITGSDGIHSFYPLPADTYRVVASATGFYADSAGDSVVTDGELQVLNISLRPIGRGNLHIRVARDTASYPPIAEAIVYAVLQGGGQDTLVGTTRADGWVDFMGALEGNYVVSAYAVGFNPNQTNRQLTTNENDTGHILLTRYTGATKTLSGIVRVRGSGIPIGGTYVTLKVGLYVIRDTAITSGDYSIVFPASFTSGRLSAVATGYEDWDSTVSLSANSITININMIPLSGAAVHAPAGRAAPSFALSGRSTLSVGTGAPGTLSLYDMGGRLVYRMTLAAGQSSVTVPSWLLGRTLVAELDRVNVVRSTVVLR